MLPQDIKPVELEVADSTAPESVFMSGLNGNGQGGGTAIVSEPSPQHYSNNSFNKRWMLWLSGAVLLVIVLFGIVGFMAAQVNKRNIARQQAEQQAQSQQSGYTTMTLPLQDLIKDGQVTLGTDGYLAVNGQLKVSQSITLAPTIAPQNAVPGQIYFDAALNKPVFYDGTSYQQVVVTQDTVSSIQGQAGPITLGPGLYMQNGVLGITNPYTPTTPTAPVVTPQGVTSFQGQTGAIALFAGSGIDVNGTTITNTGVVSIAGANGSVSLGKGLSVTGNTINNTVSITSLSATILIGSDGNGNFTITEQGSGAGGTVALGPASPQQDSSTNPSISINKTGSGNLVELAYNTNNQFVVNQNGAITVGTIAYSQVTGSPTNLVNTIGGVSGAISLGQGLSIAGNTLVNAGVATLAGTDNQVTVSNIGGAYTLALPQDIAVSSSPTFAGLTLSNALPITSGGTGANSATTARSNLGAAASGTNADITSLTGLTSITPSGELTIGATTQNLVLQGSATTSISASDNGFSTTLTFVQPTAGATITIPNQSGTICLSSGNCLGGAGGGANTSLSNLQSVALNTNLLPASNGIDIGSISAPFRDLYLLGTGTSYVKLTSIATAPQTVTLPNASGTVCLSSGNCPSTGPGGDIINNGQAGTVRIGSNDANPVYLESNNVDRLSITATGDVNVLTGSLLTNGVSRLTGTGTLQNVTYQGNTVAIAYGGTNSTATPTAGAVAYGTGTAYGFTTAGTAGQCLISNGVSAPSFASCAGSGSGVTLQAAYNNSTSPELTLSSPNGALTIRDNLTPLGANLLEIQNNAGSTNYFSVSATGANVVGTLGVTGALSVTASTTLSALNTAGIVTNTAAGVLGTVASVPIANGGTGATNATDARSNLSAAASGANADITSLTGLTSITPSSSLTIGAITQALNLQANTLSLTANNGGFSTAVGFASPTANNNISFPNASGTVCLSSGNCLGGGSGGANTSLSNLSGVALNTSLLTGASNIDLGSNANPFRDVFIGGTTLNNFRITGSATTARTITLPDATGTVCLTTGNCAGTGGGITGSGTTNTIAIFTGTGTIGNSLLSQDGGATTVSVAGALSATGAVTGSTLSGNGASITALNAGNIASGTLATAYGGTGVTTTPTNGQLLIGNGTGYSLSTLTAGSGVTIDNTAGGITISAAGGGGANAALSNLASVAINTSLLTGGAGINLGSASAPFAGLYLGSGAINTALTSTATDTRTISLPDASGTVCLQASVSCGFATSTGSGNYIQNQNSSQQSASSYWISGSGRADTSLTTPLLDTPTVAALNIGTTNASAINLNQSVVVASNKSFTANGSALFKAATNSTTAFQVQNAAGTSNALTVDTTNIRVGVGTTTPTTALEVIGDITSTGTQWTSRTSAADNGWYSITYGNGLFVAISATGTGNRVMTSPDGINWTIRNSAVDNNWRSVTYGNGLFVAVASTGTGNRVMTSPDGINWTSRTSAADNNWNGVTYGNGLFVAVAGTGTGNRVMTSPDGINWTIRTSAADNTWYSVAYGNGLFVAVSLDGTGSDRVMTSPDGINWTIRTASLATDWLSIVYGNGLFVAGASTGGRIMTSPDGINWTTRTSAANNPWYSITYGNGLFVAVSFGGTGNRAMTSPDGINWSSRTSAADNNWRSITYGNGMFVAVSDTGAGNRVMTSGKTQTSATSNNNTSYGGIKVYGTNNQFISDANSTTAFSVQNNAGTKLLNADTTNMQLTANGSIIAGASATATTATTSGTGTNTTTLTFSATTSFANGDVVFIDNAGQDYYTRITSGANAASVTVDPAVTYETGRTVTKYNVQNIGATSTDYTTQANRFYQGYFTGGIVTGAGSTTYSDANIKSGTNLRLTAASGVKVQGSADSTAAFSVQNAAGTSNTLIADTTNNRVGIGVAPTTTLQVAGNALFKNTADSTTAFSVQSSDSTNLLTVDTTNRGVSFGAAATYSTYTPGASFAGKVDYLAGSSPYDVTTADVNGDGYPDAITANYGSNNMSVLLNNGDGTFASKVDYATGTQPNSVASADLNNDSYADIIVAHSGVRYISVFINNGDGTFPGSVTYSTNQESGPVITADLDNDNDIDIVASNGNGFGLKILKNNGSGVFTSSTIPSSWSMGIAAGDINNDGYKDLVSTEWASGMKLYINNGNGTFAAAVTYTTPATNSTVKREAQIADFNNDNLNDVAICNGTDGTVSIYLNNSGSITNASNYSIVSCYGLDTGYINNDNYIDIVSGGRVLINNGNGTFAAYVGYTIGSGTSYGVSVKDINGDSKTDIIAATTSGGVSVLINGASLLTVKANVSVTASTANNSAAILQAASGQAVDIFRIQDSLGTSSYFNVSALGNVGIGVAPTRKLDVNGDTNVRGDLYVGSVKRLDSTGNLSNIGSISATGNITTAGNITTTGQLSSAGLTSTGSALIKPATNTTSAFTVQNSAGTNVVNVDTVNKRLEVNNIYGNYSPWITRNTPADNSWRSITYGNGLFVAVAASGPSNQIMTSHDGINWAAHSSAVGNNWYSVTYGNGLFVAVAGSGTGNRVMTSPDGINWTSRTSAADSNWVSVTYGNGLFVAVACGVNVNTACNTTVGNRVMTSPDGINWTLQSTPADNRWYSVTYGNNLFVAVAWSGTGNRVMTSPDGITWTSQVSAADNNWQSVTYGNGLFVAVSNTGTGTRVMTSPDGITWTSRTSAVDNDWVSVTYGNGLFVAVSNTGTGTRVMTSPDGINWTLGSSAADNIWDDVTYGNGMFVAVSYSGTGNRVMTYSTGLTIVGANNKIVSDANSTTAFAVQNSTGTSVLSVDTTNNRVGIANTSPSYLLHVGSSSTTAGTAVAHFQNADGTCTINPSISGSVSCTSDERLKKDITKLDTTTTLDKLLGISTISYHMNNDTNGSPLKVGFSAQQLETILPDLVVTGADGYKSVSYAGLTPYLVAGMQAQQQTINSLKQDIQTLQAATGINSNQVTIANLNVSGPTTLTDLTVTGNLNITGNLTLAGTLTVKDLTLTNNLTIGGHIITAGNTPTITPLPAAGQGATATIEGNDTSGTVVVTTGSDVGAGEIVQITFSAPFNKTPKVMLNAGNEQTANLNFYRSADVNKFSVKLTQAPTANQTYTLDYFVVE